MKFHSPYQFINIRPAKGDVNYADKDALKAVDNKFVRHDYWHKKGLSGVIQCSLKTVSPLVVGGRQDKADEKGSYPAIVHPYKQADGTIAIPANSLRGMIGSLAETISQSSLRVLEKKIDSSYSVRQDVSKSTQNVGLLMQNEDGNFYLHKLKDSQGNFSTARMLKEREAKNKKTYQHLADTNKFYYAELIRKGRENHAINISDLPDTNKQKGVVYIRGISTFTRKTYESFIPWDGKITGNGIDVTEQVTRLQDTLVKYLSNKHKNALPIGYTFINEVPVVSSGDLIYYKEVKGIISELSYSQIWRKPVSADLYQSIKNIRGKSNNDKENIDSLPWNEERVNLTPAEALFGVVEEIAEEEREQKSQGSARNLASRVQFSDAISKNKITLDEQVILKTLDSPKPPSPSMYFKSDEGKYVSKQQLNLKKHKPNGRKHYIPHTEELHKNRKNWQTKFTNENPPLDGDNKTNWKQYLKVRPIPKRTDFSFDIHFENISEAELGLLITTIQPSSDPKEKFSHRLGLGKPIGLGHICLSIENITSINRIDRYSIENLLVKRSTDYSDEEKASARKAAIKKEYVNKTTLDELKTLYNPDNIKHIVSYPFNSMENQQPSGEEEGFQWFTWNDHKNNQRKQHIKPIEAGKPIHPLHSFENDD